MKTHVLFDNRHEVPPNDGPLCEGFSFAKFEVRQTPHWNTSLEYLERGGTVNLYVTGLTPALTAYLQAYYGRLIGFMYAQKSDAGFGKLFLMHYDREQKTYHPQLF